MDNQMIGLVLTFVLGLFIVLGSFIVFVTKNNDRFINFSLSLAFGVMISLVILELIPESYELIGEEFNHLQTIMIVIILSVLGIALSKLLDLFIPDHEEHHSKKENLFHIGYISSIAFILHNVIEGMAVFSTFSKSIDLGVLISLGVGLHNIPLGMVITSTFYSNNKNKVKTATIISLISISTFVGGLIMYSFEGFFNNLVVGISLAITLGMLIYIAFFELLPKIIKTKYRQDTILGIILGILILVIGIIF